MSNLARKIQEEKQFDIQTQPVQAPKKLSKSHGFPPGKKYWDLLSLALFVLVLYKWFQTRQPYTK